MWSSDTPVIVWSTVAILEASIPRFGVIFASLGAAATGGIALEVGPA